MIIVDKSGRPFEDRRDHQEPITGEIAWADPLHLFANQQTQYNPSILVSRKRLQIFDQIRRDDQVKAAITFKKHALISTGWRIESPAGKPDDWEPTVFVEDQLNALDGTFKEALIQILTALDYGYSVTERIHDIEGGQVNLAALKTRAPHSMEFATDEFGNMLPNGVVQIDRGDSGEVRMPSRKFVLLQYQKEFGNLYGISDLDATYKAWWGKDNAYKWMMMLLERHGVPPIFALYNSAKYKGGSLADLRQVVQALQAASTGTIPRSDKDDLEFWAPEMAGQVSSVFVPALKMMNEDIARSILMPGLMGLTPETNTGSLARARVIFDVFILVVDYLRSIIEERVVDEQIIRPLVTANFPVEEFPFFKFNPITEDSRTELLKAWAELVGAGTIVNTKDDEDHIRQLLDFPERQDGDGEPEDPEDPEEPPEGMELEDDERPETAEFAITGRLPEGEPVRRGKTQAEKSTDFQQIATSLDRVERKAVDSLVSTMKAIQKTMVGRLRRTGPSVTVPKIMPAQTRGIRDALDTMVNSAARQGISSLRQSVKELQEPVTAEPTELSKHLEETILRQSIKALQEPVTAEPTEAIKYLEEKILWITDVLGEAVIGDARQAMLKSIELGESTQEAIERLRAVFEPYIGSGQIQREGRLLTPHRTETIVRTNTTDAFNKGRLTEIMRPELDGLIDFVQYSAIMDTRTTQVCRTLDEMVFRRDDPALQDLVPPNHFNALESGTLVTTIRGDVLIEDVDVGDLVLTHRGRFRRVYAVMEKCPDRPINELHFSTGRKLRISDEHPVLTGTGWSRVDRLQDGDVAFQHGEQVPGSIDVGVLRPDDYPSIFDEDTVPYELVRFSRRGTLGGIDLKPDFSGKCEVDDLPSDRMLKVEGSTGAGDERYQFGLGIGGAPAPGFGSAKGSLLWGTFHQVGVALRHALAVLFSPFIRLLAPTVCPMTFTAAFGDSNRIPVRYGDLCLSRSNLYAEPIARQVERSLANREVPFDGADRFSITPMSFSHEAADALFIRQVHKNLRKWSGAAIISSIKVSTQKRLYNLGVEDDETYLANGIITHNCRSVIVPVTPDIEVDQKDIVTGKTAATARDQAGKGFTRKVE